MFFQLVDATVPNAFLLNIESGNWFLYDPPHRCVCVKMQAFHSHFLAHEVVNIEIKNWEDQEDQKNASETCLHRFLCISVHLKLHSWSHELIFLAKMLWAFFICLRSIWLTNLLPAVQLSWRLLWLSSESVPKCIFFGRRRVDRYITGSSLLPKILLGVRYKSEMLSRFSSVYS